MPFDISEIKNLPTEEKLRIIDELWESIDTDEVFEEESPEVIPCWKKEWQNMKEVKESFILLKR